MRMAALVCFDGLIPLGPDFILKAQDTLGGLSPSDLSENSSFSQISSLIPGGDTEGKLNFIGSSFDSVKEWMGSFVSERNLTREGVVSNLQSFIEVSDNSLDYLGAFLDVSTNYYEHTGTQTLAKRLIDRAYAEI